MWVQSTMKTKLTKKKGEEIREGIEDIREEIEAVSNKDLRWRCPNKD